MKYLALLVVMETLFFAYGISQVNDDVVRIEGPPPRQALPEMLIGSDKARRTAVPMVVRDGAASPRTLIFEFHLSAARYDHLSWEGHGLDFPRYAPVLDFWQRPVANITAEPGDGVLASPDRPLLIPESHTVDLARWFAERMWIPFGLVVLFFALRRRVPASTLEKIQLTWWLFVQRRPWLLTVVAMTGAWLALIIPGAIRYDVGDDPAMEMLASGYVTGQPSAHLVFINVLYGFILEGLYRMASFVPWYPLVLVVLLLVSLGGSARLVLQNVREVGPTAGLWLAGLGFGGYFVSHLQFTSVAYLIGLLGLLLFSLRTSRSALIAGVALVFLGSLIRWDSFLLLLLTALPAAWLTASRTFKEKLIFVSAIVVFAAAGLMFDHAYSAHDPGWGQYREYNRLRGDLHMNPKLNYGAQNRAAFAHVGWSENDVSMFDHWLYEDPAVFSADKLAYLDHHLTSDRNGFSVLILFLAVLAVAPIPVLIFFTLLLWRGGRLPPLLLAAVVLPAAIILGYLAVTARVPARVALPPLYAASLFLLLGSSNSMERHQRSLNNLGLPLVFFALAFFSLRDLIVSSQQNRAVTASLESNLRALTPVPDQVIVASINAVPLEHLSPFTAVADMRRLGIVQLMWSGGSPSFAQQLQRYGSTSLFPSLEHDPRFCFAVPTAKWERAAFLTRYWQEHAQENMTLVPETLPDGSPAVFSNFTLMQAVPGPATVP